MATRMNRLKPKRCQMKKAEEREPSPFLQLFSYTSFFLSVETGFLLSIKAE